MNDILCFDCPLYNAKNSTHGKLIPLQDIKYQCLDFDICIKFRTKTEGVKASKRQTICFKTKR